jgi:hypothetical protein
LIWAGRAAHEKKRYRRVLRLVLSAKASHSPKEEPMKASAATHDAIHESPREAASMKWVLWLNTIGETAIAVGMFTMPASFFPGAQGLSAAIARAFSFAIFAVAFISFSATRKGTTRETERNVVGILVFYHAFQLIAQFVNAAMYPPVLIPPVIIHIVYSSLFVVYALRLRRPA